MTDSLSMYGEPSEDISPDAALSSMCEGKLSYDGMPTTLVAYDPQKLKMLQSSLKPRHVLQFLPPEAAKTLDHFESTILGPPRDGSSSFTPYWDPSLRFVSKRRLDLILRLFHSGLLCFRRRAQSFVGLFFVKKKTGYQRI